MHTAGNVAEGAVKRRRVGKAGDAHPPFSVPLIVIIIIVIIVIIIIIVIVIVIIRFSPCH